MATEIELTPSGLKLLVAVYRDGKAPHRDRFDPVSAKQRKAVADKWGVDEDTFSDWCEQARVRGGAVKFTLAEPPAPGTGEWLVRPIAGARDTGTTHRSVALRFVKDTLPGVPVDHVAEWGDAGALCCLDVDYHEHAPPARDWLETFVTTRLVPQPLAWHFSRGGGLHLFYVSAGAFTADELASVAALRFRSADPTAGLELKTVVRGPGDEPVHHYATQDTAAGFVAWLGAPEYDESARDEWLESRGMECGKRYEHTRCPIDPGDGAERDPVIVMESGLFCFRCDGKGLTLGSRRAGYVSWATLLGSPSAGELGGLVRNLVHWGQAKWVLTERYGLPDPFARLAYRAALKAYHEGRDTEGLIGRVFDPVTDALARVNNLWLTIEESYAYPKDITPILARLPVCLHVEDDKVKVDPAVVCELNQTKGIARYGYRDISVVHGYRLASRFLPDADQTTVAVLNPDLRRVATARRYPRYVPVSKRMPESEAWAVLETILPRLDRTYIRTLIASFGCAQETRLGLPPIMFISGVSAAGKTAMAQVAAGILGARVGNESKFDADESRFREAIRQGAQEGPVVVVNELLKDAGKGRNRLSTREALDFVLTMTPYSASHQLYKGPVKMGRLPSLVLTETQCPEDLREETQLARRIRHHYVSGAKRDWKQTIAAAGLTNLNLIRGASDAVADACNSVLSGVVDECFALPATWDQIADGLGVKTIEDSTDFMDPTPWLRELFRLVCAAPAPEGRDAKLHAEGFKKIARGDSTPGESDADISTVYSMFADPGNWGSARRLLEKDWSALLKTDDVVKLDLKSEGNTVYLRYRVGPMKKPLKVNGQIADPTLWEALL